MKLYFRNKLESQAPTVYGSLGYGQAAAVQDSAQWAVIADDSGEWQMPLLVRKIKNTDWYDAISPYGYSGIFHPEHVNESLTASFIEKAVSLLQKRNIVSVFLRFCPFCPSQKPELFQLNETLEVQQVSQTIEVPLSNKENRWATYEGRVRTAIRKAHRLGFQFSVRNWLQDDFSKDGNFRSLYESTMARVSATPEFYFSDSYYDLLSNGLGDRLQVAEVRDSHNNLVAASLLLVDSHILHYHLSGSSIDGARGGANNLLLDGIFEWGEANGFDSTHLGGGLTQGDSLFKFKKSFGGRVLDYNLGKFIVDQNAYKELVGQMMQVNELSEAHLQDNNFFPLYRWRPR